MILTGILPSAARFFEFLDQKEESNCDIIEDTSESEIYIYNKRKEISCVPEIEYQNVFFSYGQEPEQKNVINGLNLCIPSGEKLALIGRNGCGKTTLINLLLRLDEIADGDILVDGKKISEFDLREYRKLFSVVSQQIYLFNDTIRNNICMYQQFDEAEILTVLEEVGLGELIRERGLDFIVGINGTSLSGGQKQKIALARALLHNRPIFIFDEATSNTDIDFEMRFRRMLKDRLIKKTVIFITHNADLLREADQIVLMEEGEVICAGAYDTLLAGSKAFAELMEQYKNDCKKERYKNN